MTFIYLFNSSATIVYWPNAMSLCKLKTLLKPIPVVANKQFRYICKTTKVQMDSLVCFQTKSN